MELLKCALYVFVIGIATQFAGQALPRQWFDPDSALFRQRSWEKDSDFYRKIRIRKWKHKLPDASKHSKNMYRKAVNTTPDAENLERMVQETCVAEFAHTLLILLSLGVVKIWKGRQGWICWLLCLLGNLPFILIQRFNRPRLQSALARVRVEDTVS